MKKIVILTCIMAIIHMPGFSNPLLGHWKYSPKGFQTSYIIHFDKAGFVNIKKFIPPQDRGGSDLIEKENKTYVLTINQYSREEMNVTLLPVHTDTRLKQQQLNIFFGKLNPNGFYDQVILKGMVMSIFGESAASTDTLERISRQLPNGATLYRFNTIYGGLVEETVSGDETWRSKSLNTPRNQFTVMEISSHDKTRLIQYIIEQTNLFRKEQGGTTLRKENVLTEAADKQLGYLACEWHRKGFPFLSHSQNQESECLNGMNVSDRIGIQSPYAKGCGENIHCRDLDTEFINTGSAIALKTEQIRLLAELIVDSWKNSPGHRKNMLYPTYQSMGASVKLIRAKVIDGYYDVKGKYHDLQNTDIAMDRYMLIAAQVFSTF